MRLIALNRVRAQTIEVVRPDLHHLMPQREVLRVVVRTGDLILFNVRELPFHGVRGPPLFIE